MTRQSITPLRALVMFTAVFVALMVFIAVFGTLTNRIDATAIFAVCGTIVTGLVGSIALRIAVDEKKKDDKPEDKP